MMIACASAAQPISGSMALAARQPSSVSSRPITRASGMATPSWTEMLAAVAIWSLPAPARSPATPAR
jgi:hypothetical protein